MECPHCGGRIGPAAKLLVHPVFDDEKHCLIIDGRRRFPTVYQWRLLWLMRERFGRFVPAGFLAQHAAKNPADGGNDGSLKVQLCKLRPMLDGSPFAIATAYAMGYGLFPIDQVERRMTRGYKHFRLRPQAADAVRAAADLLDLTRT